MPSERNVLVDILLARGVNGESPVKRRPPRKSARTPKPHSSASRSRTKTPRTGASKRALCKSSFVATVGDENYPPSVKKRRDTSKTSKLKVSERTNGALLRQVIASRLTHLTPCVLRILYYHVVSFYFYARMGAGTSAGLSLPLAAAQGKPFADQLADASAYHFVFELERKRFTRLLLPSQSNLPKRRLSLTP